MGEGNEEEKAVREFGRLMSPRTELGKGENCEGRFYKWKSSVRGVLYNWNYPMLIVFIVELNHMLLHIHKYTYLFQQ